MTPTLLLILDGWGIAEPGDGNAPWLASTPNLDTLFMKYPHSKLRASGRDVGLPDGYMGNSEVGHLNIGSGRIVNQDMTRIDLEIERGLFVNNPVLTALLDALKISKGTLHLVGLVSDGGVHSHINHLKAVCEMADNFGVPVRIHCITDGRDTDPRSGLGFISELYRFIKKFKDIRISDVIGRFYAMDRDNRWERVKKAWDLIVHGVSDDDIVAADPVSAIRQSYENSITDEFVKPVLCGRAISNGHVGMSDGDGVFFFNFRADRMRELAAAFIDQKFNGFDRGNCPHLSGVATMTSYDEKFSVPVVFPKEAIRNTLGEIVSAAGMKQLRLAETEKYAHVTYFFNGGVEEPFPGESRILVPSPRDVSTYDQKPAMSAVQVTEKFIEAWRSGKYDLVVCNLANGDMVGHTGNLAAAIAACEVVDKCVGKMVAAVHERNGRMMIIADHGNCEVMVNSDGKPQTAHTTNLVPCILIDPSGSVESLADGRLSDVAPTLLALWGIEHAGEMTGKNLANGSGING